MADLKAHCELSYSHSVSVAQTAYDIGKLLQLGTQGLEKLAMCALLHDIGKATLPHDILSKPTFLTHQEQTQMMDHAKIGGQLLCSLTFCEEIRAGVAHHHEKWDGTGYPDRLKGDEIPLLSRIIAVADVFCALIAHRPYRMPATPFIAVEYIILEAGRAFDRDVVRAFCEVLKKRPSSPALTAIPESLRLGKLTAHVRTGIVTCGGVDLYLTKKEYMLLLFFIQNRERYIKPEDLYQKVWNASMERNTNALRGAMKRLRKKIKGCGYTINNSRTEGYILERE